MGGTVKNEQVVDFEVVPLKSGMNELCFMIVFQEETQGGAPGKPGKGGSKAKLGSDSAGKQIKRLEHELLTTKEHLQSVVENQEATNEALQSANEEILSSNEELQSTNEELETAKEELQSTNEELSTVNDELRSRNLQIAEGQKELKDMMTGIYIAVVGADSKIREFTPQSQKLLGMLPDDISGPIRDGSFAADVADFPQLIKQALSATTKADEHIVDRDGKRYRVRVLPYKGPDGKTEGRIVTLIDYGLARTMVKKSLRQGKPEGSDRQPNK